MPTVKDGDCVSSLAAAAGVRDYHSLWDDPVNADLKKARPNPNALVVGDEVKVPAAKKVEKRAVDKAWTFVVKTRKNVKLRLVLVDRDGKGVKDKEWKVTGSSEVSGKTGADGLIELDGIPPADTAAKLVVQWAKEPAAAAPAAAPAASDPPPYPPAIVAKDFTDEAPPARDDAVVEWTLKVGSLPTFDVEAGVQARLHNLAFACDVGSDAKATSRAVKAYQSFHLAQKDGSGKAADIQADVRDRHDRAP